MPFPSTLIFILDKDIPATVAAPIFKTLQLSFPLRYFLTYQMDLRRQAGECWSERRGQFNGNHLLERMIDEWVPEAQKATGFATGTDNTREDEKPLSMLITPHDCFTRGLNFIFAVARAREGCLVSTHRLGGDEDFLHKEATHELGHVYSLSHCRLPCVMCFSNSVWEAHQKSAKLCGGCSKKVERVTEGRSE